MLATRYEGHLPFLRANESQAPLVQAAAFAVFEELLSGALICQGNVLQ